MNFRPLFEKQLRDPVLLIGCAIAAFVFAYFERKPLNLPLEQIDGKLRKAAVTYSRGSHNAVEIDLYDFQEVIKMEVADKNKERVLRALSVSSSPVRLGVKMREHRLHKPKTIHWAYTLEVNGEVIQSIDHLNAERISESNFIALFGLGSFITALILFWRRRDG